MKYRIINYINILKKFFWRKYPKEVTFISRNITLREYLILFFSLLFGRNVTNGNDINKYESEFTKCLGIKYAFSFGAGRMALYAILKAMGIKKGDEVILQGYTCVVVPNAIVYCGAKPIYCDINPNTLTIDVSKIEEKITSRTKAIIVQHTFESFCDMDVVMDIARRYHLKVIEDCAHALGAEYDNKKAGSFGDAAFFTTEQSKIISTGMGGVATTNDKEIAGKIREIQNESKFLNEKVVKRIVRRIILYNFLFNPFISFIGKYIIALLHDSGFLIQSTTGEEMKGKRPKNYPVKLANIQAKIGLGQLKKLNKNLDHRRKIAMFYKSSLKRLNYEVPESNNHLYKPSYIRYWFLVNDIGKLKKLFNNNGIELGEWFNSPIHPKGSSLKNIFFLENSCPAAKYIASHNVNLPTHEKISIRMAARVIKILKKYNN